MYKYALYILPVAILPQGLRLVFRTLCSELLCSACSNGRPTKYDSHWKRKNMTYKCGRGSDWAGWGEVLWLMKEWYAFDAAEPPVPTEVNPYKVNFETDDADGHIVGDSR